MRLITAVSVLPLFGILMPTDTHAQQVPPEIIDERSGHVEVTASASVEYEPDRAYIAFAVTSFAKTAAEATDASAVKMTNIQKALKDADIQDRGIQTTSFRLDPHYPSDPETRQRDPQPDGYTAFNMVDVTVEDVKKVGQIIDTAIDAGADNVSSLRFGREDLTSIHREALKKAYENAEDQAETLASAAGKSLGTLISVRTPPASPVGPTTQLDMVMMRGAPTPIETGTLSYSVSVQVVFELR